MITTRSLKRFAYLMPGNATRERVAEIIAMIEGNSGFRSMRKKISWNSPNSPASNSKSGIDRRLTNTMKPKHILCLKKP
jgi:hypothetical protein